MDQIRTIPVKYGSYWFSGLKQYRKIELLQTDATEMVHDGKGSPWN